MMVCIVNINIDAKMDVFKNYQFELGGKRQEGCWHFQLLAFGGLS